METVSFAPIIDKNAKILILGTMPGIKSLQLKQYYAHEQNSYWKIIFNLFGQEYSKNYDDRIKLLQNNRLALWDTLKYCTRKGSLDSDIIQAHPNQINELLSAYQKIKFVIFNGAYAEKFYRKFHPDIPGISYLKMPSTSPANARYSFTEKLLSWSVICDILCQGT